MLEKITKTVKTNVKTSITLTTVVAGLTFYTALTQVLDQRYTLAAETKQMQNTVRQHMQTELDDRIFFLQIKENNHTITDAEKAMLQRYLRRQEKQKNGN